MGALDEEGAGIPQKRAREQGRLGDEGLFVDEGVVVVGVELQAEREDYKQIEDAIDIIIHYIMRKR